MNRIDSINLKTLSEEQFSILPPGMSSEEILEYIDTNWDIFAAFAYN